VTKPAPQTAPGADNKAGWPVGLEAVAEAALPDFLLRQRWYPAKDAARPAVRLAALVPLAGCGVPAAAAVWEASPPGRTAFALFVPLAVAPAEAVDAARVIAALPPQQDGGSLVLIEATAWDGFIRAWIGLLLGQPMSAPGLRAGHTGRLPSAGLTDSDWAIRRSSAEQSNTSIRVGEHAILKIIRKVEEGIHPELEVSRFLTADAGFTGTPALLGWVDLEGGGGKGAQTLSILQAFVPNQGDAWSWILERLRHEGEACARDAAREETIAWVGRLGVRTAEMHKALARDCDDPAFRPEAVTEEDIRRWRDALRTTAGAACDGLSATLKQLPPPARALAGRLIAHREEIDARVDRLLPAPASFDRTRHHGDFHLGQVLVTGEDATIIDFEGEPMRPLAERRAKHAALRDVAGLLRSLSYAAASAARELPEAARAATAPGLASWEERASRAFFDAYLETARGAPGLPADTDEARRVVRFFMLEKALYEVTYELANRPAWVEVPLAGVIGLIEERADARPRAHRMPFGAEVQDDGAVRFRLWAPPHDAVRLEIDGGLELLRLRRAGDGWHELTTKQARAGSRYRFVLPDGTRTSDPASRSQPEDLDGPSEVCDPSAYAWTNPAWRGRPWEEAVIYELHIGAFTPEGTFGAAIGKLDHLVDLGISAIELMPIGDFPGRRNWGYDGVLPYAPDSSYGRPEDLKALIDAAHGRGLMVLLDVVYNHFGPEGSFLQRISPTFFTERHKTAWGGAVNMEGAPPIREYFIHNALYWIEEFNLDGLRFDAVHAIFDSSAVHVLRELAERVRTAVRDRPVHLILENEENEASRLARDAQGQPRAYTAQWNDDAHHVLHVAATGENSGYYADFHGRSELLGRALAEGFAFQGETMPYRGAARGEPSASLPPTAFVAFLQNHDQVGNRAFGDRLDAIATPEAVRAVGAICLLLPQIPMLFMGEEWDAAQPFPFFCDFSAELAEAVRAGRREEFARFPEFQSPATRERIPDPTAEETFLSAKLAWADAGREPHAGRLAWHRHLIAVRRREIVPILKEIRSGGAYQVIGDNAVVVRWRAGAGRDLALAANLSSRMVGGFPPVSGRVIWREGAAPDDGTFGPYAVRWSITERSGDGHG
jgi:malto-oligosyltrehalose trehalohydrolase